MTQRPPGNSALGAVTILSLFIGSASLLVAQPQNGQRQTTSKPAPNQTREKEESLNPQAARQDPGKTDKREEPAKAQQPGSKTAKPETWETPKDKAWSILQEGVEDKNAELRAKAVRALGLLPGDQVAESIADKALHDEKTMVRAAAAEALGSMSAKHSMGQLRGALDDSDPQVVLAAANALVA